MGVSTQQRQWILAAALGFTLLATYKVSQDQDQSPPDTLAAPAAEATTARMSEAQPSPAAAEFSPYILGRARSQEDPRDIFTSKSWQPPQPRHPPHVSYVAPAPFIVAPRVAPSAPAAPSAPPLPFSYMGKVRYGDQQWRFFLVNGKTVHTVRAGEVVEGIYKIEGLVNGQLEIIYLPLNIKQTLSVGDRS